MRGSALAWALLIVIGCGKRERPPPLPQSEAPAESPSIEAEEPVEMPAHPTAAFVPPTQGGCDRAYRLVQETCVHRAYEPGGVPALNLALAAYKRGVAPPLLGGPALARKPAPPPARDPGSLMRRTANATDAGAGSKDLRLAELDAMLAAAREKLRQRDEASKAKKVENAPRKERATKPEERATQSFAGAASSTGAAASSGDPAAARMNELSQLAGQLSGEQLQALTHELGKTGFNQNTLEAILAEARDAPPPH